MSQNKPELHERFSTTENHKQDHNAEEYLDQKELYCLL